MSNRRQDPVQIIAQIISLQCLYYVIMGILFTGCHLVYGLPLSLDRFFDLTRTLNMRTEIGRIEISIIFVAAILGAFLLRLIVEKSRKCLDFSATFFAFHFFVSFIYSNFFFPKISWWFSHILALILLVVLGEYLCARRELREIPLLA